MSPEREGAEGLHIRPATIDDHAAFVRLFPELRVDDPIPDAPTWARTRAPGTLIAAEAGAVVAYCYFQEHARLPIEFMNVVVEDDERLTGVLAGAGAVVRDTALHLHGPL